MSCTRWQRCPAPARLTIDVPRSPSLGLANVQAAKEGKEAVAFDGRDATANVRSSAPAGGKRGAGAKQLRRALSEVGGFKTSNGKKLVPGVSTMMRFMAPLLAWQVSQ